MSVAEVTNRCFQNGLPARKWLGMCRLFKETIPSEQQTFESELCNSILALIAVYPADQMLLAYIKTALHEDLITLPIFLTAFLDAVKSLHDIGTLDSICKLICEEQLNTGLHPNASLIMTDEPTTVTVRKVQASLMLLRATSTLPPSPFHDLLSSASNLVALLLTCISDISQLSMSQALNDYSEVQNIIHTVRLGEGISGMLENYALSLSMVLRDDAKLAQEAQMMQTLQLSQGKGDILGSNSQSDIVSCSLMLRHLVMNRTSQFGSGDTDMAVALMVSTFRWTSWSPRVFYTQLFQAAVSILAQVRSYPSASFLWKSFIITRLTTLLPHFERVVKSEPMSDNDWRGDMVAAMSALSNRRDILAQCDEVIHQGDPDEMPVDGTDSRGPHSPPFFRTFLQYCVHRTKLIDKGAAMQLDNGVDCAFNTQLGQDALDNGQSLDIYVESKFITESNNEESLSTFVQRAFEDIPNHPLLVTAVQRRLFALCQQHDVEGLGILCKVLNLYEPALDVISIHVRISDILAHVLAFVDDFDCESVGDPQTAVGHLGNVILFLQSTITRYQLSSTSITIGERTLKTDYLLTTSSVFKRHELSKEEFIAVNQWRKALFDQNSEGIDDSILRATKPKSLMRFAATLVMITSNHCAEQTPTDMATLNNGVSYFTGPLLNWTLVGVIKALLRDILEKDFEASVQLEVLNTLLQAPQCPLPVLCLTAHGILALTADPKLQDFQKRNANCSFDAKALRALAYKALGTSADDKSESIAHPLALGSQVLWLDQPRNSIRDAITMACAGKAPFLDVVRCVTIVGPTKFISILWDEVSTAAQMGHLEIGRRLATYALLCPPSGRVPPLLPLFFGSFMHTLLARIDSDKPGEQTINIELLVAIIGSSLTGVLHFEWAIRAGEAQVEARHPVGQPSVTIAKRLAVDMKRSRSTTAAIVIQRLSSSPSFVANLPMMVT